MFQRIRRRQIPIPSHLEPIRNAAMRALGILRAADSQTIDGLPWDPGGASLEASLPPYYLVYLLLVDFLGFPNLGRFEKVAWSVPVQFDGELFLIEHRKFGLTIVGTLTPTAKQNAQSIASSIHEAVKIAEPFYEWLVDRAYHGSELNVINRSRRLFQRFEFWLDEYKKSLSETAETPNPRLQITQEGSGIKGIKIVDRYVHVRQCRRESGWFGLAVIDAFFSWTEHIFIHLAILQGQVTTGNEVADLSKANWADKFKKAINLSKAQTKEYYDKLLNIRNQFRNFNAHGAFGKERQAFEFHSGAGTVPLRIMHGDDDPFLQFGLDKEIPEATAIQLIEEFIEYLWSSLFPTAYEYLHEAELPSILSFAVDGTYKQAMTSAEEMRAFVEHMVSKWEQAANMDW